MGDEADETTASTSQELYGLGSDANGAPVYSWFSSIPVCFTNASAYPSYPEYVRWILTDTWSKAANLRFNFVGACNGSTLGSIAVSFGGAPPPLSGLTVGLGRPAPGENYRNVYLPTANDNDAVAARSGVDPELSWTMLSLFRTVVIHEFGHALGFAHEMQREDAWLYVNGVPTYPPCAIEAGLEAQFHPYSGGIYWSTYDSGSMMNYCAVEPGTSANWVQNLTNYDESGVRLAYGNPPARVSRARNILWRSGTQLNLWHMRGTSYSPSTLPTLSKPGDLYGQWDVARGSYDSTADGNSAGDVAGTGDFDGDGIGDVIMQHPTTGVISIWYMNSGSVRKQVTPSGAIYGNWRVEGTGDFNGDGKDDILWRAYAGPDIGKLSIWPSGGTAGAWTLPAQAASWVIQKIGRFDPNGLQYSDILWRNVANGDVAIWRRANPSLVWYPPTQALSWKIKGVGDFNGDHVDDILWRSDAGQVAIWFNRTPTGARYPGGGPIGTDWQIAGVGDFNGDGVSDILWRANTWPNQVAIWWNGYGPDASRPASVPAPAYPPAAGGWQFAGVLEDLADL